MTIKSAFKISHRLIKKAVNFKSNRNTIKTKLYDEITIFNNYKNAKNFEKLMKKYDSLWKKKHADQNFRIKLYVDCAEARLNRSYENQSNLFAWNRESSFYRRNI